MEECCYGDNSASLMSSYENLESNGEQMAEHS
jgi:hypothetical protein